MSCQPGVFVFNLGLLAKVLSPSQDLLSVKFLKSKQRPAAPLDIHGPVFECRNWLSRDKGENLPTCKPCFWLPRVGELQVTTPGLLRSWKAGARADRQRGEGGEGGGGHLDQP